MQVCFCVFSKNKSLFLKSTLIAIAYNLIKSDGNKLGTCANAK
ncbi:hypothetical protein PARC_a1984 [Pseudoalteromonas arctica A 37-1-2]|uniref:Uncharacterized protein n=1 Tax=Pseudoalteromonas arctica A 37-1-2 TaxID=1117313 RepID=A0A290S699_9GAMM|nr:hypothetical protein PARC_a1984 [Pseudoalteromonas arctica A 37-1-2]